MSHGLSMSAISRVILVKGVLNSLLGALHVMGTFTFERAKIAGQGTAAIERDYLIWFYGVGVFIVFMGLLDIICSSGLKAGDLWAWRACLACSAFNALLGVSGVVMFGISPPLQLLLTGLIGIGVLLWSKERRSFIEPAALESSLRK